MLKSGRKRCHIGLEMYGVKSRRVEYDRVLKTYRVENGRGRYDRGLRRWGRNVGGVDMTEV